MNIQFGKNDLKMFLNYVKKSSIYFEYGIGGSTCEVIKYDNLKKIYSIESDYRWCEKVLKIIKKNEKINIKLVDLKCKENSWGYPSNHCSYTKMKEYSDQIKLIDERPDLILIDGRFRVCCCLKAFDYIDNKTLIAFDDFVMRKHYHEVLKYYDIIKKTIDNRMVILRKKNNISIPKKIIEKYELDPR